MCRCTQRARYAPGGCEDGKELLLRPCSQRPPPPPSAHLPRRRGLQRRRQPPPLISRGRSRSPALTLARARAAAFARAPALALANSLGLASCTHAARPARTLPRVRCECSSGCQAQLGGAAAHATCGRSRRPATRASSAS